MKSPEPEVIDYNLVPGKNERLDSPSRSNAFVSFADALSASVDSEVKQTGHTVTTVTTTATQVQKQHSVNIQKTGQSFTSSEVTIAQNGHSTSQGITGQQGYEVQSYSRGQLQNGLATVPGSISTAIEVRRIMLPSKSTVALEDRLIAAEEARHQTANEMLLMLKAQKEDRMKIEDFYSEQIETLRLEYQKVLGQLSVASSEISTLKIQVSSYDASASYVEIESTVTTVITTVTTTITTVTTRIEQWRDEVVKNKGKVTITKEDLEGLLSELSKTSSHITKLQESYSALVKESGSVRHRLELTLTLVKERDGVIATLTAEVAGLKQSDVEKTRQIASLREKTTALEKDSSKFAELQKRYDALSRERDSVVKELQHSKTLIEERGRKIVNLDAEVKKLKRVDATKTEQLHAAHHEIEKLRHDFTAVSSQKATLQKQCDVQTKDITSLRGDITIKVALLAEQEHTITTVTTERDRARREVKVKEDLLVTMRQDMEQFTQKLVVVQDEKAAFKKQIDAQSVELRKLHEELTQIKHLAKMPGGKQSDDHVAEYIASALKEKEKQLVELRQTLATVTARSHELEKSQEVLSGKVTSLRDELKVKTSQYQGTIDGLTIQLKQFKTTSTEKTTELASVTRRVQESQLQVTTLTAQFTELKVRFEAQSKELSSVTKQLQTVTSSEKQKVHEISSLIAERDREKSANVTKTEQITKLREEFSVSTSELTKLKTTWKSQSEALISVQNKLRVTISSSEKHERMVAALTDEVAELRRVNTSGVEQLTTSLKQVEHLQRELTSSRSRVTKLQHDTEIHLKELQSLRKQHTGKGAAGGSSSLASLTAQVKEWKELCSTKSEELVITHKKLDEIKHELENLTSQYTHSREELTAQLKRLQEIDVTKTTELTAARTEIDRLHHELDVSSSRITQIQQELTSKTEYWQQLDSTKEAEYKVKVTDLTSQVEHWQHEHDATEEVYDAARKRLQQVQNDLQVSSTRVNKLQQQFDTQSTQLTFFREQFSGVWNTTVETEEEWRQIQTKIMSEVKDYATVIQLTTDVDEWMGTRAKVLAEELEKRNRENEELRQKLVTLRQIYVSAPRIKQIFQSESIEIKKRYEEESVALKTALVESQSQLRGVQRVVAPADTYADEAIIQILKKLNAEIQQNATLIADGVAKDYKSAKVTKAQITAASKFVGDNLANCLATMKSGDVGLYLPIAFQAYVSHYLFHIMSSWTIEKGHNEFIERIYEQLQKAGKISSFQRHRRLC